MRSKTLPIPLCFDTLLDELLPKDLSHEIFEAHGSAKRRPPVVSLRDVVKAMTFQALQGCGCCLTF